MAFRVPEDFRLRVGALKSTPDMGNNGCFLIPPRIAPRNTQLACIASDGDGDGISSVPWEHVSVSTKTRAPYWDEMCFVKSLFWQERDIVIQYHPAKSDYINQHPHCLHLWRPVGIELPTPPKLFVGFDNKEQ